MISNKPIVEELLQPLYTDWPWVKQRQFLKYKTSFYNCLREVAAFCSIFRYYGRKILHIMYDHPEFDKNVTKYVPSNLQKNVRDTVENLRTKVTFVIQ